MSNPLESMPVVSDQRIAVHVTRDAERQLRGGHPWLFDRSITSVNRQGDPGDLAVVFDSNRKFLAIGLWDPASPMRVRVLHRGTPTLIDEGFWQAQVEKAMERREPLIADGTTSGYRLIHGENDGFGGLIVDIYDRTGVVKVYSAGWFAHLGAIVPILMEKAGLDSVVLRLSRLVSNGSTHGLADGMTIGGTSPTGPIQFLEHNLSFSADVERGQKTGFFLDQRSNREMVGSIANGAAVLDVFCASGGFSVHAAAGGADEVVSTDLSRHALAETTAHMNANMHREAVAACRHRTQRGDAFEVMAELAEQRQEFDIIIVDPPSFASRRSDVEKALRAYGHLTRLALSLVSSGGTLVLSSCSSRVSADAFFDQIETTASAQSRKLLDVATTGHDLDHPITFPEAAYLKAMFLLVD